jgi:putative ubiquitin-RnfH superfamily antitoxin RatB of RatAB toxin-antitoxin module
MSASRMQMRVQVVRAWARDFEAVDLELPAGARVADAVAASGLDTAGIDGYAIFGERVSAGDALSDGDRVELLRPLQADPKDARRRRAARAKPAGA